MLKPSFTKQFDRDLKRMLKRGKEKDKIKLVVSNLINEERLEPKYKDHKLVGNYEGRRECHIEPDWLLISGTLAKLVASGYAVRVTYITSGVDGQGF